MASVNNVHLENGWSSTNFKNYAFTPSNIRVSSSNRSPSVTSDIYRRPKVQTPFSSITKTLGFSHHQGTDKSKELAVVKYILARESVLLKLKNLCTKISQCNILVQSSLNLESELLDTLALMRTTTTNFIEILTAWRESDVNHDQQNPRTFIWDQQNYTLKVTHDLDFLAEQPLLVASLQLSPDKMRANPLMLPNTLEEGNTWVEPSERVAFDCDGATEGEIFDQRLRVRNAERVLLVELEIHSYDGRLGIITDNSAKSHDSWNTQRWGGVFNEQEQNEVAILTWKLEEALQLNSFSKGHDLENGEGLSTQGEKFLARQDESTNQIRDNNDILNGSWANGRRGEENLEISGASVVSVLSAVSADSCSTRCFDLITASELQRIIAFTALPPRLILAASAVVILLARNNGRDKIPQDVSIASFRSFASQPNQMAQAMNEIDPNLINRIKIKALMPYTPLLHDLNTFPGYNLSKDEIEIGNKICRWVIQVISLASGSHNWSSDSTSSFYKEKVGDGNDITINQTKRAAKEIAIRNSARNVHVQNRVGKSRESLRRSDRSQSPPSSPVSTVSFRSNISTDSKRQRPASRETNHVWSPFDTRGLPSERMGDVGMMMSRSTSETGSVNRDGFDRHERLVASTSAPSFLRSQQQQQHVSRTGPLPKMSERTKKFKKEIKSTAALSKSSKVTSRNSNSNNNRYNKLFEGIQAFDKNVHSMNELRCRRHSNKGNQNASNRTSKEGNRPETVIERVLDMKRTDNRNMDDRGTDNCGTDNRGTGNTGRKNRLPEMWPVHNEMIEEIHGRSLLLSLLSTLQNRQGTNFGCFCLSLIVG